MSKVAMDAGFAEKGAAPVLRCPACGGVEIQIMRDEEGTYAECACGFEALACTTDVPNEDLSAIERVFRGRGFVREVHPEGHGVFTFPPESIDAQQRMAEAVEEQTRRQCEQSLAYEDRERAAELRRVRAHEQEEELHSLRVAELKASVKWREDTALNSHGTMKAMERIAGALERIVSGASPRLTR